MKTRLFNKNLSVLLLLFCIFVFPSAKAADPVTLLKSMANNMIAQLEQNKSQLKSNPKIIHRIVDDVVIPNIDVNRMAGMVVGRQYWYSAPPALRREFVDQFKRLVINTYSNALASYDDDKVVIYPLRENYQGQRFLSVDSAIVRKSGQRIPISYKLISSGSDWKVYDFSIAGVSIVQNYRSQFSNTLASGGMVNLVNQLKHYNKVR